MKDIVKKVLVGFLLIIVIVGVPALFASVGYFIAGTNGTLVAVWMPLFLLFAYIIGSEILD